MSELTKTEDSRIKTSAAILKKKDLNEKIKNVELEISNFKSQLRQLNAFYGY